MSMSSEDAAVNSNLERDPVEQLAEEFLRRRQQAEPVSIAQYAEKYPELAERIRHLFPALLLLEQLKPGAASSPAGGVRMPFTRLPNSQRLGDFRLLREIGQGGMGVVYEAEQESLGRRVALKVLPTIYLRSATRLQRFQREAQAAARLHHTNIVPIFGVGQQDGVHYYVMQLIAGQGLDRVLAALRSQAARAQNCGNNGGNGGNGSNGAHTVLENRTCIARGEHALSAGGVAAGPAAPVAGDGVPASEPDEQCAAFSAADAARMLLSGSSAVESGQSTDVAPWPSAVPPGAPPSSALAPVGRRYWQSVARLGIQVAGALSYAHQQGTLHRDIKPANLLLDNRGITWVADFGLAKLADDDALTGSGDMVGTLRYMAPEQYAGEADARSDVYGLGLTLYELLTLRPVFEEKDPRRLLHAGDATGAAAAPQN